MLKRRKITRKFFISLFPVRVYAHEAKTRYVEEGKRATPPGIPARISSPLMGYETGIGTGGGGKEK